MRTTPNDALRTDGVTIKPDGRRTWNVLQGRHHLGRIWDEGAEMTRGRYAAWAPYADARNGNVGFFPTLDAAAAAVAQEWPLTASEVAQHTGVPVTDILTAAELLESEWRGTGRRAILRIATATGHATKIKKAAAAVLYNRLPARPASAPEPEPKHCVSYNGGKVHEVQPTLEGGGPEHVFPLCRTGDQTNQGTRYRKTTARLSCSLCVTYRDRRRAAATG
ncbi:hypothetical protein G3M53_07525 [Streptomyces sp. SID7982]|nr:hypothetical protein [Streptomyces sp. SID7982]